MHAYLVGSVDSMLPQVELMCPGTLELGIQVYDSCIQPCHPGKVSDVIG